MCFSIPSPFSSRKGFSQVFTVLIVTVVTLVLAAVAVGYFAFLGSQGASPRVRVAGTAVSSSSSTIVRVDVFNEGNIELSINRVEIVGEGDLAYRGANPLKPGCAGDAGGTVSRLDPGSLITVRVFARAGDMQVADQAGVVVTG